jgi:hypothetical protein
MAHLCAAAPRPPGNVIYLKLNQNWLASARYMGYFIYMENKSNSFSQSNAARVLREVQSGQITMNADTQRTIGQMLHAELEDRYHEEQALLAEVYEAPEWEDHYEDVDYGYHDQYDF